MSARECVSRHTLSKKLCQCDVRLGLLFHRPLVSSTSNVSRVRWTRAFVEHHLKRCITFYVNPLKGALEIITIARIILRAIKPDIDQTILMLKSIRDALSGWTFVNNRPHLGLERTTSGERGKRTGRCERVARGRKEDSPLVFRGRARDVGLLKSHHYRPFDKADKAHKECLSHRAPDPVVPLLLVWYLNVGPRPTCLALALLLLIFLSSWLCSLLFLLASLSPSYHPFLPSPLLSSML